MRRRYAWVTAIIVVLLLLVRCAGAKLYGLHSPGGREIYGRDELFHELVDARTRRLVVEAAVGSGPEGNVGVTIGWLNQPIAGLGFYAGFGVEWNPARNYSIAGRYTLSFGGFRPYAGVGYLYRDVYEIGTYSHGPFLELGHSWAIHQTYQIMLGGGVRYLAYVGINDDSVLQSADIDPAFLEQQRLSVFPLVPTVTLRFSRAF